MKSLAALCLSILCIHRVNAVELNLPLHPAKAKIIQGIAVTEGVEVVLGSKPGFSARGAAETLVGLGVPKDDIASVTVQSKEREAVAFTVTHDKSGHVLAITGNGPWLRNSTLRSFKALPELRIIRMDHNGFVGKDPRIPEFDGCGFDALTDSKLADIKIGLSFSDKGMEQCAKIKALRSFSVAHSQATGAGIAFFAGHPGLTSFSISEMGKPSVTEKAFGAIAKIPNLTRAPRAVQGQTRRNQPQHVRGGAGGLGQAEGRPSAGEHHHDTAGRDSEATHLRGYEPRQTGAAGPRGSAECRHRTGPQKVIRHRHAPCHDSPSAGLRPRAPSRARFRARGAPVSQTALLLLPRCEEGEGGLSR
jgi:hypothetical protein